MCTENHSEGLCSPFERIVQNEAQQLTGERTAGSHYELAEEMDEMT